MQGYRDRIEVDGLLCYVDLKYTVCLRPPNPGVSGQLVNRTLCLQSVTAQAPCGLDLYSWRVHVSSSCGSTDVM